MKTAWLILAPAAARLASAQALTLEHSFPLPGVTGRIDHLEIDPGRNHLLVAALGNGSLEMVDLGTGQVVKSVTGLSEPQGVALVAEMNRVYVACADGKLEVYEAGSLGPVATIAFDDDADNVRFLAASRRLYVGHGSGGLGIVDVTTNTVVGDIPVHGHPESFQLEKSGRRGFVNVPGEHNLAVVDLSTGKTTGNLPLGLAGANYPMALDESGHRLFVGCRLPARLLVFDTESGREVAKLDLHGDCDDVFFDAKRQWMVATCGAGYVDIFRRVTPDRYEAVDAVRTVMGARTGLLYQDTLYLAVPKAGSGPAEIRCYRLQEVKP